MLFQAPADKGEPGRADAGPADPSPTVAARGADDPLDAGEGFAAELWADFLELLPWLFAGLGIFLAFWLLATILRGVVSRLAAARGVDRSLGRLLAKAAYLTLLVTGLLVGLETAGLDMTAAIAGLGLTGFALGFALKDIVSNLIAGVLIILYKPFDEGDTVKCGGFEGGREADRPAVHVHGTGGRRHLPAEQQAVHGPDRGGGRDEFGGHAAGEGRGGGLREAPVPPAPGRGEEAVSERTRRVSEGPTGAARSPPAASPAAAPRPSLTRRVRP